MTLKELSQLYYLNREIESDMRRLEELKSKAENLTSPKASEGSSGSVRRTTSTVERLTPHIIELKAIIEAKQKRCMDERIVLEKFIASIPDSITRQAFTYRFVNGLDWPQVAYHIGGGNTSTGISKRVYRYLKDINSKED